ncbi:hypothetical protein BDA96_01G070700 [Sorghum bicolor]|uniref:Uncharacterized protein n=1 Tax=Sorghum bicolor TaxID=4558 RepID=A0A921RXK6_SORBI|nr:hypothetical protein BDA96_01G070700 [Sorghum bicolor]
MLQSHVNAELKVWSAGDEVASQSVHALHTTRTVDMLHGNGSASSWRSCGWQQLRESVWSPTMLVATCKMPGSHLQSSDWRPRVPSPDFSYDVTAFKCMLHSRPYQHMLQAVRCDDRIRCSYLLRSSVYHIWIGFGSLLCTVLLLATLLLSTHGYSPYAYICIWLGALSLPRWNVGLYYNQSYGCFWIWTVIFRLLLFVWQLFHGNM